MSCVRDPKIQDLVNQALAEDIGRLDITTEKIVAPAKSARAVILAKENCVVCGLAVASLAFKAFDKWIKIKPRICDGTFVKKGEIIAYLSGKARSIITAERVALNFLCFLSGICTKTRSFVSLTAPYKVKITDTRKTLPGLRLLEKYAVRLGGGFNHRYALDEMILVKDNHIKIAGGVSKLRGLGGKYGVEIEVKNLKEFKEALSLKPDIIMLDNMSIKNMKKAVCLRNRYSCLRQNPLPKLEASGGVTLKNVKKVACLGIDFISVGELTHSVDSVDLSLEIL